MARLWLCCCYYALLPQLAQSMNTMQLEPDMAELELIRNISHSIGIIINKSIVLDKQQRVCNMYAAARHQRAQHFFGSIMERVVQLTNAQITIRMGMNIKLPRDNERHYSVVFIDNVKALEFLFTDYAQYHLHLTGYFIIFLHNFSPHYAEDLRGIFALNWQIGLVNANVLVHALANLILLYSAFPFGEDRCKAYTPQIQNRFVAAEWQHLDFYPDKLSDLHGCALTCATWEDMPYFKVHYNAHRQEFLLIGLEGKLLEYLAAKLNFTIDFYWLNETEIAETLDDEGALFSKLFSAGKDFAIGAFRYKPTKLEHPYAPTSNYYLSTFRFIINVRADSLSPFVKLLYPFFLEIWLLIVFMFVCAGILLILLTYAAKDRRRFVIGSNTAAPIYNMFVVGLGGNIAQQPQRNFARYLLLVWLFTTLVLRCSYQALLFHFMRTESSMHLPQTIAALLQDDYRLLMTEPVYDAIYDLSHIRSRAEILNVSELHAFAYLRQRQEKIAILTAMEYFGYYRRLNVHSREFYIVPEPVFTQQLSIYMRKSSVLLTRFNRYILEFINSGLKHKWDSYYLDRARRTHRKRVNEEPTSMKLIELSGAFRLLLFGWLLSLAVYLFELIFNLFCSFKFTHKCSGPRMMNKFNKK